MSCFEAIITERKVILDEIFDRKKVVHMNIFKNRFLSNAIALAAATVLAVGGVSQTEAKGATSAKITDADEDIRIVKVDDSNFEKEILHSKTPIILEISSTSCPPCLVMIPTLIGIAKNYRDIKVASVGIDEPNIDKIKNTLPIQAFPTFFLIKDGQIVNRLVGVVKEEQLLQALDYTPSAKAASANKSQAKKPAKKTGKDRNLVCKVNGQFHGLKNLVTISFVFGDSEIKNVDIITDVFVPPEMSDKREEMMAHIRASGKGEVTPTMAGFQMHIDNDCRFMKAMDMKRTSTYGEMRAGLELQGFKCE